MEIMSINSLNSNLANVAQGMQNQGPQHLVPQPGQDTETFARDQFESGNLDYDGASLAASIRQIITPGTTVHVVTGTEGNDKINIKQGLFGGLTVDVNGEKFKIKKEDVEGLVIAGMGGDDQIVADKGVKHSLNISGGEGDDYIVGGRGGDWLMGNGGDDVIKADGEDFILGGTTAKRKATDLIKGGDGNDQLSGGINPSIIYGGPGDDAIDGGLNAPPVVDKVGLVAGYTMTAYGEEGDDYIVGTPLSDYLNGGPGTDTLIGGGSWDKFEDYEGDITDRNTSSKKRKSPETGNSESPSGVDKPRKSKKRKVSDPDLDAIDARRKARKIGRELRRIGDNMPGRVGETISQIGEGIHDNAWNIGRIIRDDDLRDLFRL